MNEVDVILARGVREGGFPGAAYAFGKPGKVDTGTVGRTTYDPDSAPVTLETVYDLASLTKVLSTTPLVMRAIDDKLLRLDTKAGDLLPGAGVSDATVWHLLTHSSGLPPYDDDLAKAGLTPEETRLAVVRTKPVARPGEATAYSCLGFIVLATILETLYGEPIDRLFTSYVAPRFGIASAGYLPKVDLPFAPTDPALPPGTVHDPLARAQAGVSGNAGLFGTVGDVSQAACFWIETGLSRPMREWTKKAGLLSTRALGWDTKSPEGSSAGSLFGPRSFGHTGYTGTSLWIDPDDKTFVALLTNRCYPDDTSKATEWARPAVADAAKQAGV